MRRLSNEKAHHGPLVGSQAAELQRAIADLPVVEARLKIVEMITNNRAVVIVGETGSGKTTQIPQYVLDDVVCRTMNPPEGSGLVGITQPRRVAAVSIATYVAALRDVPLGTEVGYAVRFDDKCDYRRTKLRFMTDGILLRELLSDPLLHRYSVIILDEAHERTLHGDVLFGLLKQLTTKRPDDLKIVIMSATLNSAHFSQFWRDAPIGYVTGRTFPVAVYHTIEPQLDYVDAAISAVTQIHLDEPPGDILCFLTGEDEIEDAKRLLVERDNLIPEGCERMHICTLYSAMGAEHQMAVLAPGPSNTRKVILATNIAETSITINGVKYVVDSGMLKAKQYNAATGLEMLLTDAVSKAQARQRAGRAGRVSAGKCFRLYTEPCFEGMAENPVPEILRCNLQSVVLQMKAMNINDILGFDFMDRPSPIALVNAMGVLARLGALDEKMNITRLGLRLADFPLDPMAAKTLIRAEELGVGHDACAIIAMLSTENIILSGKGDSAGGGDRCRAQFARQAGDHIMWLSILNSFKMQTASQRRAWCDSHSIMFKQMLRAVDTTKQLMEILSQGAPNLDETARFAKRRRVEPLGEITGFEHTSVTAVQSASLDTNDSIDHEQVRRAFCAGYFLNAAFFNVKLGNYVTVFGQQRVHVHPSSVLFKHSKKKPALVIFNSVVRTSKNYMRDICVVREEWLREAGPALFASLQ